MGTTMQFSSGLCFTLFMVSIVSLLIITLCVIARFVTIEKQVKNQFKIPKVIHRCQSDNRGFIPLFRNQEELSADISQTYYYHDCCWRSNFIGLPGEIKDKIKYTANNQDDSPLVTIFKYDNILYCIYRSTKTKKEMMKDIEMSQMNEVHSGFRDIHNNTSSRVIASLNKHGMGDESDVDKIILFGHSLGGALVDLLSEDIIYRYPNLWNKMKVISSGSPRVFAPTRADEFSFMSEMDSYMKIENAADMVPSLPSTATTIEGILSTGKKFFYKSFSNKRRIHRFNFVKETQLVDSHLSSTYSDSLWNTPGLELPCMFSEQVCKTI